MRSRLLLGGIVVLVVIGLLWWSTDTLHERQKAFFSSELQKAGVREADSDDEALETLKNSYALAVAARSPIFGLAGTDPDVLASSTAELAIVMKTLSEEQSNDDDARAVEALYPVRFLRSLAELEKLRRTYLASGSPSDGKLYHEKVGTTLDLYATDLALFAEHLKQALPEKTARIPSFGGTITTDQLRDALGEGTQHQKLLKEEYERRAACFGGDTRSCDAEWLKLPSAVGEKNSERFSVSDAARAVLAFRNDVYGSSPTESLLVLASSTCLATKDAPYTMAVRASGDEVAIRYVDDLFFSPTADAEGATVQYLNGLGIEYAVLNPMNYYTCPDLFHDTGRIVAMLAIRAFAADHPEYASELRSGILKETLSETAIEEYLSELIAEAPEEVRREVGELILMYTSRTAGLEFIVEDIVDITQNDLRLASEHVPFDLRVQKLYISHSAFPSLFLLHAGSARANIYEAQTERDAKAFSSFALPFSDLLRTVPRKNLIDDVQRFLRYEGRI